MQKLLTLCGPDTYDVSPGGGIYAKYAEYSGSETEKFKEQSQCFDLYAKHDLRSGTDTEWDDRREYRVDITPECFVIGENGLAGYYYGSRFLAFDDTAKHTAFVPEPSGSSGGVSFTLRPRPNGATVLSEDGKTLLSCPKDHRGRYTVPQGVAVIAAGSFYGCAHVTEIIAPESVKTVQRFAFENCLMLRKASFADTVEYIDPECFVNIPSPMSVTVPPSVKDVCFTGITPREYIVSPAHRKYASLGGVLFSKDMKTLLEYPRAASALEYDVPDGVTVIESEAFAFCMNLRTVRFPETLAIIKTRAFVGLDLESVILPEKLEAISEDAFHLCKVKGGVSIPRGTYVFY